MSELAERNSTISGHMDGSKCNLKMHIRNLGYPFPLQNGGPKPPFLTISQLKGNFNGLCLRNETRYTQAVKCVANYKESPTSSQKQMNFGPQTASNWSPGCLVPGPTGDFGTPNPVRLPLILGFRSTHDQNAEGVERKENGNCVSHSSVDQRIWRSAVSSSSGLGENWGSRTADDFIAF